MASGGKYRTVCVRACDGYYFPISNAVTRARFMRDSAQCRASCGEEARLYYLPASSDNVSTMLDLAGRSYVRMPNAFKYRKSLINGCSCKPMPWSEAELLRHRQYAAEAALAEAQRKAAEDAEAARQLAIELGKVVPASVAQAQGIRLQVVREHQGSREHPNEIANAEKSSGLAEPVEVDVASVARTDEVQPAASDDRARPWVRPDRTSDRAAERSGGGKSVRREQRPPAVARVSAPAAGSGGSWFPTASPKYTWPGDPPRR